jgi:hypothetical protein
MSDVYTFFLRWLGFGIFLIGFFSSSDYLFILVAHQLHTSKHNTSTHHDEQIEVNRLNSSSDKKLEIFLVYRS